MAKGAWKWAAIGLIALGAVLMVGLITVFPSTTTCVGLFLFNQCAGYYSTTFNGNNFLLGLASLGVGGFLYVWKGRR